MKVVVIGGSGLIGTKLVKNLRERGQQLAAASPSSRANTSLVTNWLKRCDEDALGADSLRVACRLCNQNRKVG
jgi:uncharacterized protein YbjT (DUF2867 family)